jgi:hypothetical protein
MMMKELTGKAFWAHIGAQLEEAGTAGSAADVLRIFAHENDPYGEGHNTGVPAFFAGSGGDDSLYEALSDAGWEPVWWKAGYWWCMKAPDGSAVTYVEGDIYEGTSQ